MRIRQDDVDHVRQSARIEDVIGEQLALKPAGAGSLKGLCPFHDERTPSFNVRPAVGRYHCFGCGEGGDVIDFVQKVDHLSFADAVERLAARIGYQVRYEDDGGRGAARREGIGTRQRLIEANRVAAEYFVEQLSTAGDAATGRAFLLERGFDQQAAAQFGVGFAPRTGEAALRHLRGKGFTEDELVASGLAGRGQRGLYDRFRGRLVWPIRDLTGDVVGFGARRLFDDDRIEAKYLNTPETAVYKKSQLLYGVDLAKREIARQRQLVVVEGYTDVMACHLAGIGTAVATCGTAFGADHIRIVRRLLGDDALGGQVVFTFDGDEAGQKAALKAFEEDQRFVAQTWIAVAADGYDPCELRQRRGDEAVRELITARTPLFEFAIRATLARYDLDTAEGRVAGLRSAAPVVARIRDSALRPEYARQLAGWLGMEVEPVRRAVQAAAREAARGGAGAGRPGSAGHGQSGSGQSGSGQSGSEQPGSGPAAGGPGHPADPRAQGHAPGNGRGLGGDPGHRAAPGRGPGGRSRGPEDPIVRTEREALECLLQLPMMVPPEHADALPSSAFRVPAHRAVFDAIRAAGGMQRAAQLSGPAWVEEVRRQSPEAVTSLVGALAVAALPADREDRLGEYARTVVLRMAELAEAASIADLRARVQRLGPGDAGYQEAFTELLAAETRRRSLREQISGS